MNINNFDPNGVGVNNGNFIGLPFDENSAALILFPVAWDMTVSYRAGTANGAENLLNASYQLDLYQPLALDAWKKGIYFVPVDESIKSFSASNRHSAQKIIETLEKGIALNESEFETLSRLNDASEQLNNWVEERTLNLLQKGKKIGLIGGDHSTPLGYYKALAKTVGEFGILQIDAHCDLRKAYEGFKYSHASIFYNTLKEVQEVSKLVQVGIRDYCDAEVAEIEASNGRIKTFFNFELQASKFEGIPFKQIVSEIVAELPAKVHISFDIDGLMPDLCPNTGTPVPGGLSFDEAVYLIYAVKESGRTIIGFDLCEVAGDGEWDGNVGARIAYTLSSVML